MPSDPGFDQLLENNRRYATKFPVVDGLFDGIAHAGLAMITCMDSRIEPLAMVGLELGDAKILRTPGAQVTDDAHLGSILAVNVLGARRIMIVQHTRCAMGTGDDAIRATLAERTGTDVSQLHIGAFTDFDAVLERDVTRLRAEPLLADAEIGGFRYDVDTGLLERIL